VVARLPRHAVAQITRRGHRVECGADNLRRTRTIRVIAGLGFEKFGVGEDDAQLIIQAMQEDTKIGDVDAGSIFGRVQQDW
jgi:hypothetical protein